MIDSLKRSANIGHQASGRSQKLPPPIMPKPKELATFSKRNPVKSKSEVDISKFNRPGLMSRPHHHQQQQQQQQQHHEKKQQQPIDQPTSSTTSSSSPSSSSVSTNHRPIHTANDNGNTTESKIDNKLTKKLKSLEMNSLKSSSQGYYSDTSRSSKQSFEFESVRANLRNVKKPPQFNDTDTNKGLSSSGTASSLSDVSTGLALPAIIPCDNTQQFNNKCTFPANLYVIQLHVFLLFRFKKKKSASWVFNYPNFSRYFKDSNYDSINKELNGRSCSAHYNDNGTYRLVSIDSNDVCTIISSLNGIFDSRGGILDCSNTGLIPFGRV